jgi:hypothetical protein
MSEPIAQISIPNPDALQVQPFHLDAIPVDRGNAELGSPAWSIVIEGDGEEDLGHICQR